MACMEHICIKPGCDGVVFNNSPRATCPLCGGMMIGHFDEVPDFESEYAAVGRCTADDDADEEV